MLDTCLTSSEQDTSCIADQPRGTAMPLAGTGQLHDSTIRECLRTHGQLNRRAIMAATGLGSTTARNSLTAMTERGELTRKQGQRSDIIYALNPEFTVRAIYSSPLTQLTKKRGCIRSKEAAQKLGIKQDAVETEMRHLASIGEAVICDIYRPAGCSEIEMRLSGHLPNASGYRIKP